MAYNPGEKSYTLYIREKFFYQEFGGRTVLTQTKSPLRPPSFPLPSSKVKWSAPKKSSIGHRLSSSIFNNVDKRDGTS